MKVITIVIIILLILSLIFGGILWLQFDYTRNQLFAVSTQLVTTEGQLNITETELDVAREELGTTRTHLAAIEVGLSNALVKLQTAEVQLTGTKNQLEKTESLLSVAENQLEVTESQLSVVETQLEKKKNEQLQMLSQYSSLSEQVNLRFGIGEDSQRFIIPDNALVSTKASEIAGEYSQDINEFWSDYMRLYRWVVKNIQYSLDSYLPFLPVTMGGNLIWRSECWKMPAETMEDGVGDCEDMAVLLASLMLSYNEGKYGVWAVEIHNESTGHLAVAFPVAGNKLTILDPAGNYYTGYPAGYLMSYDVDVAVSKWLSHWKKEMPGAEIGFTFSNKIYRQFSSSEEFINWVKD